MSRKRSFTLLVLYTTLLFYITTWWRKLKIKCLFTFKHSVVGMFNVKARSPRWQVEDNQSFDTSGTFTCKQSNYFRNSIRKIVTIDTFEHRITLKKCVYINYMYKPDNKQVEHKVCTQEPHKIKATSAFSTRVFPLRSRSHKTNHKSHLLWTEVFPLAILTQNPQSGPMLGYKAPELPCQHTSHLLSVSKVFKLGNSMYLFRPSY